MFGVLYWYVLFSFLFVWINYFNPLLLIDLYQPGKWVAMYMCAGWSIVPLFQQCSLFDFGTDPTMRLFFVFHSILYCDFLYVWIVGYCTVYKYLFYTCIISTPFHIQHLYVCFKHMFCLYPFIKIFILSMNYNRWFLKIIGDVIRIWISQCSHDFRYRKPSVFLKW